MSFLYCYVIDELNYFKCRELYLCKLSTKFSIIPIKKKLIIQSGYISVAMVCPLVVIMTQVRDSLDITICRQSWKI